MGEARPGSAAIPSKGVSPSNVALASEREMAERLRAFVAAQTSLAPADVRVGSLRRLAGGASRELWSLDVELGGAAPSNLPLVLRRDPPGRVGESDRGLEFRVLRAAAERLSHPTEQRPQSGRAARRSRAKLIEVRPRSEA